MKAPYLVQRAKFKENGIGSIDDVMRFDYMGSAEFEFGALPKSLKRMTSSADKLSVYEFIHCVSGTTKKPLYVISVGEVHDDYLEHILLMSKGELRLKECSHFDDAIKGVNFHGEPITKNSWDHCDVWWDIENDIMFAFGDVEIKRVLDSLMATRDKKKVEKTEGWY